MDCILGIDTSNYTTSVCAVRASDGAMVAEARMLLPVSEGERGLRQSDALFFHVKQLPLVVAKLMASFHQQGELPTWKGVGVSVRPRPFATSYMPVFLAGLTYGSALADALGIPLTRTSHQEGHLAAAEVFAPMAGNPFVAVHVSGGTSDVVVAVQTPFGYRIELVGGSADLHAGQFVDRVGVKLNLAFPAGPQLESLSHTISGPPSVTIPAAVKGASMSFSGPFSAAMRAIEAGVEKAHIAYAVEDCIARSISKAVEYAVREQRTNHHTMDNVLIAGGVASNQAVKAKVTRRLERRIPGVCVQFAPPEFCRDNALGVARIAFLRQFL